MLLANKFLVCAMTVTALAVAIAQPADGALRTQHPGEWTQPRLRITPERLGAVTAGMTLRQARRASGLNLQTGGDGEYYSPRAPGLIYHAGYSGGSCVSAARPSHVYTAAGVTFGDTRHRLRAVYGKRLHFHTGPTGYSDPTSYYVRGQGRDILFFHLSHRTYGRVIEMASGRTLGSAYC